MAETPFTLDVAGNSKPHYVREDDELVQTLLAVYHKYRGDFSKAIINRWRYVCTCHEKRCCIWYAISR